jgi:hypothetical protein
LVLPAGPRFSLHEPDGRAQFDILVVQTVILEREILPATVDYKPSCLLTKSGAGPRLAGPCYSSSAPDISGSRADSRH